MNLSDESAGVKEMYSALPRSKFLLHDIADRAVRRRLRRLVLLDLLALDLPHGRAIAQADAPRLRADLDNLEIVFLAGFQRSGALQRSGGRTEIARAFVAPLALFNFGVVAEPFDVLAELHERAERADARNFSAHDVAHLVLLEPVAPEPLPLLLPHRHPPAPRTL